jgi:hypothetical protein
LVYLTRQTTVPQIFICGKFIGGLTFFTDFLYDSIFRIYRVKPITVWKEVVRSAKWMPQLELGIINIKYIKNKKPDFCNFRVIFFKVFYFIKITLWMGSRVRKGASTLGARTQHSQGSFEWWVLKLGDFGYWVGC